MSDSRQTMEGRIRKAARHQNEFHYLVIIINITNNTLTQVSANPLDSANF